MRRIVKLSLLCIAAGAGACSSPDLVIPTENLPYAGVRFINAVPDSAGAFGLDFRFVDLLESNAHFRVTFRNTPSGSVSTAIQYKGAREGSRHFRIFLDDTLQSIASTVVKDSTVALVREHNYTAMLWGNGRAAAGSANVMRLGFWEEDVIVTDPGQVKLRVINATANPIDAYIFLSSEPFAPAVPSFAAVPAYSRSSYVQVPVGTYNYLIRNAGTATQLVASTQALIGAVATCSGQTCQTGQFPDIEAAPGTRVAGSAVTGIVFPPSVSGSRAAQFTTAGITFMWDKRPPRTCDPYC